MPAKFDIRAATLGDAVWFSTRLREADRLEVEAACGKDVETALRHAVQASALAWVASKNGLPIVLLGCADFTPGVGSPWLMATDEALRLGPALTALAKERVALVRKTWPKLLNYVDARNLVSVRWLKRIGFKIHETVPYGVNDEPFHPFSMGA
ncbi:hypothetical protein JessAGP_042c [Caulobacter phage Jess A]|nr:hypothetical protein JessAGP_042c [Caulobacter phage Jess A]QNH91694.1 hypothetical protein SR18_gp043c [Caulobacter phage SR18]WCA46451.1 hypothetical protein [Caulobacter phage RapA]